MCSEYSSPNENILFWIAENSGEDWKNILVWKWNETQLESNHFLVVSKIYLSRFQFDTFRTRIVKRIEQKQKMSKRERRRREMKERRVSDRKHERTRQTENETFRL